jgi:glycosyltransferase involved in cell wall biosynthesis
MKVLVMAPQPFFSERGTPIAVRRLVEALCRDGNQVDLLTYPFGDDIEVEGLTIHRAGRFPGVRGVGIGLSLAKLLSDLMLVLRLFRLGRPGRYQVVHAVEESVYGALLLRWRHRARVVYDMDSSLAKQLADSHAVLRPLLPVLRRIERWAIKSVDAVAPMCLELAAYAGMTRDGQDEVVVLHDVPVAAERAWRRPEAPSSNGAGARCVALYVGNLEPYQGVEMLVDAAALLPSHPAVRVQVVGGPMGEVDRLRTMAQRRGLHDRIQFLGPRPLAELYDLLAGADILLSPRTKGDNTPLKLFSYMESGRPILATRLTTHTQVLDDSTALLVEPEARAFAAGLLRLAGDEGLRRKLGESAKRRVRCEYSPTSFYQRVRSIYGGLQPPAREDRSEPTLDLPRGEERRSGDRRSASDRRGLSRAGPGRRVAERRVLVYA